MSATKQYDRSVCCNGAARAVVSEKATMRCREERTRWCFACLRDATKPEIKAAVELLFKVEVESVSGRANVKGKDKRFGKLHRPAQGLEEGVRVPEAGQELNFVRQEGK